MAQYILKQYLEEVSDKHLLIKNMKAKTRRETNSYEYEKILASYYLIEVCSGFEYAVRSLIGELLQSNSSSQSLKSYLLNTRYLTSVQYSKLCGFLKNIDKNSHRLFKDRQASRHLDAMSSLYDNRQRIVHYGESRTVQITLGDVEQWRKDAAWVLRKFETVLKQVI